LTQIILYFPNEIKLKKHFQEAKQQSSFGHMHGLLRLQLTLIQALDQGEIGGSIKQR
jgi:hypothetical protein